ncbi:MAG: aminotransferase class V-fold PLP-dependent enzyme [Candidatus Micrarchaeota archaeon]|nr:aminotransferase class V-fold PLP-dependent enzyme [Candidatus Micrarchaeota archaeon]
MAFDVEALREDFPYLKQKKTGKTIAYLDNAATTQKPLTVIEVISDYYSQANANPHRGGNALVAEATEKYENARKRVAKFIGARQDEIIFTKNATESLNLVARMAGKPGERVLLSQMEHHSNIVPWQLAGARLEFVELDEEMKIDLQDAKEKLAKGQSHVFSFAHASNVLGCVNDAQKLCRMARDEGALSCVDAAQSVPHMKVDVAEIGCDFLAFSGHKMLGPDGLGVLYIRREIAQALAPVFGGGGAIEKVGWKKSSLAKPPHKFEPGTQNSAGAIGLSAAMDYLEKVGWKNIGKHSGEDCFFQCGESACA